jgi:N4-gp56 family major capsid protein
MAVTGLSGGEAGVNGGLGGGAYSGASNTGTFTPSNSAGLVQKAYDRLVEFELRATPLLRSVADKKPARQAMPGSSVALQIYNDMAVAKTVLSEEVDPAAIALSTPDIVTVTLNEYGNATLVSKKLGLLSLADVDPAVANIIAFNMADSIDELAQDALLTGTNVLYATGGTTTATTTSGITADDTLSAADIRRAVAKLRTNKANGRKGSLYWCGIHPEVSHDLRAETGAASWRNPHEYQSNAEIWAGEIGQFEGAYFVESARMAKANNTNSVPVYKTIIAGQQALAEAVAEEPHVVIGPVTDRLNRLRPIGWYGVLGFKRYREDSLYRIESASTISA